MTVESRQTDNKPNKENKKIYPQSELKLHVDSLKHTWERIRMEKCSAEERTRGVEILRKGVQGRALEMIYKHDASRIIQTILKYSKDCQIQQEFRKEYATLAKSKYARFIVLKTMKYCKDERTTIITELRKSIPTLIKHRHAGMIVDEIYSEYLNASQRLEYLQECYGQQARIFKPKASGLKDHLESSENKGAILTHLGGYLEIALEKTPTLSILHALCLEYMNALEDPNKFLPLVHAIIPAISHTKDGAIIAMMALAHGGAKERKVMLKEIKASAVTMSKGEYGHWVIMQIFECVDDTVLISKNILQDICKEMSAVLNDKYGRRTIMHLLAPRKSSYFGPEVIRMLAATDPVKAETSKKASDVRYAELRQHIDGPLSECLRKYVRQFLRDDEGRNIVFEFALKEGDSGPMAQAIVETLSEPADEVQQGPRIQTALSVVLEQTKQTEWVHVLEDTNSCKSIKKLLNAKSEVFAMSVLDAIEKDLEHWLVTSPFILLAILDKVEDISKFEKVKGRAIKLAKQKAGEKGGNVYRLIKEKLE